MSFVLGANLPWVRYGGDFGANAWSPGGGLATRPADQHRVLRCAAAAAPGRRDAPALVLPVRCARRHPVSRRRRASRDASRGVARYRRRARSGPQGRPLRDARAVRFPPVPAPARRQRRADRGPQPADRARRSARAAAGQHRRAAAGQLRPRAGDWSLGPVQRARVGHLRRRDLESGVERLEGGDARVPPRRPRRARTP